MTFPDAIAEAARCGRPITGSPVIDAHGHLGLEFAGFPIIETRLKAVLAHLNRMGIGRFCVSGIAGCFGASAEGNAVVREAIREAPDRIFGYMTADVGYPDRMLPELERCLKAGFRGVKVWSMGARPGLPYNHPNYTPIFEFANAHHLPVLAHVWGAELDQLKSHVEALPNVNWLMAHTGSQDLWKYIEYARKYPTVYLETCISSCPHGLIERLVAEGLEDKVVWGSDLNFMDSAQQFGRVAFAQIPETAKRKILGINAALALRLEVP